MYMEQTGLEFQNKFFCDVGTINCRLIALVVMATRSLCGPSPSSYWCQSNNDRRDMMRYVLIHEIAQRFGFTVEENKRVEHKPRL